MMLPSLQHSDRMIATPLGNIKTRTQGVAYRSPEAILLSSLNSSSSETSNKLSVRSKFLFMAVFTE